MPWICISLSRGIICRHPSPSLNLILPPLYQNTLAIDLCFAGRERERRLKTMSAADQQRRRQRRSLPARESQKTTFVAGARTQEDDHYVVYQIPITISNYYYSHGKTTDCCDLSNNSIHVIINHHFKPLCLRDPHPDINHRFMLSIAVILISALSEFCSKFWDF